MNIITNTRRLSPENEPSDGARPLSSSASVVDDVDDVVSTGPAGALHEAAHRDGPTRNDAGLSLRANFSWTFIGNVVNTGSLFLSTVVLAKIGTPTDVGGFAMGLALTTPVFMFAALRLRDVQATDAKQEYQFSDYFALRLITTALAVLACLVIVSVTGSATGLFMIVAATTVYKSVEAISDSLYGLFMQQERLDRIAKSMMMKGPLALVGLAAGFSLTHRVVWGIVGMTVGRVCVLCLYDFRNVAASLHDDASAPETTRRFLIPRPRWNLQTLSKLTWLTLPLGLVMMLSSLNANIPRYLIEWHLGAYQLGIFAAVASFQRTAPTVVQALGRSASPRLAKYYAQGNVHAFVKLSVQLIVMGIGLCCLGVFVALVAGHTIVTWLYGREYDVTGLFEWIMLAAGFEYIATMLAFVVTSARYYRVQLPLQIITAVVTAMACVWLVPAAGLVGAAMALVLGNLVRMCGCLLVALDARRALICSHLRATTSRIQDGLAIENGAGTHAN